LTRKHKSYIPANDPNPIPRFKYTFQRSGTGGSDPKRLLYWEKLPAAATETVGKKKSEFLFTIDPGESCRAI
jgi:hypothetical protein